MSSKINNAKLGKYQEYVKLEITYITKKINSQSAFNLWYFYEFFKVS